MKSPFDVYKEDYDSPTNDIIVYVMLNITFIIFAF